MSERDTRIVLGSLLALVALATPSLGEAPTHWRVGTVHAHGLLGPLVRAADGTWDVGVLRAPALAAGLVVALLLVAVPWLGRSRGPLAIVATIVVAVRAARARPSRCRQACATRRRPWFHDNDSTYQIELAGDLVRHGTNPYGHDYRSSGMQRIYSHDGSPAAGGRDEPCAAALPLPAGHGRGGHGLAPAARAARRHPLPRLPREPRHAGRRLGLSRTALAEARARRRARRQPADDPRRLVRHGRRASLAPLVLAFGLVARRRLGWAALALGSAILLKQFAIVAVPFLGIVAWQTCGREATRRAGLPRSAVVVAGCLPFLAGARPR